MSSRPRCIVVGAGLFGLAAAWAMSRRAWEVEVLEAGAAPGHEWSGSKGGARIFRRGYLEAPYVELARRAGGLWAGLEAESGRQLLLRTGQVSVGEDAVLRRLAARLDEAGVTAHWLPPRAARSRLGTLAGVGPALVEPDAGVLLADECLRAFTETGGFVVRSGVTAAAVVDEPSAVHVVTTTGRPLRADVAVVCAGTHTLRLIGQEAARVAAPPTAPQVAYFRTSQKDAAPHLPVFIEWGAEMIYGLPVHRDAEHGGTYKMSHHTPGTPLSCGDVDHAAAVPSDDGELLDTLVAAARRLLPALDPRPVATERCVYDNTTDAGFVLDRVGRVVIGCGTSGHGFKFGPLVGLILADLAEGVAPVVDLAPFRLAR